ncbi:MULTISPECIES: phage minor head protein [Enterococcus]|nr:MULTISPECIES: phage minor head protein [Enterococcus]
MDQLNKWQQELKQLTAKQYQKTDSQLFNLYRKQLIDIKKKLKHYTDNADNLSFSTRLEVERLFNVAKDIDIILSSSYPSIEEAIKAYSAGQAQQGYYGVWYSLEQSQNIVLQLPLINHDYVMNLVNAPVAGKRLSKRLYQYRDKLADNVTQNIITGLFEGKSYAEIARRVNEETEASYKQALRIARTEAGRTQSTTTQKGYIEAKKKGIDIQKRWLATLDKKTRHDHRELDGQTIEVDEKFSVRGHTAEGPRLFGVAREDVNCRCTTIEVINGVAPELRKNNETKEASEYKNYEDWLQGKTQSKKVKITDFFNRTNAREMLGNQYVNQWNTHISSMDNSVRSLFDELGGDLDFFNIKNGRAFASRNKLQLSIEDFSGDKYHNPLQVVYHEAGHAFDSLGLERITGKNLHPSGNKLKVKRGKRTIEVDEYIRHASALPKYNLKETMSQDFWRYINGDLPTYAELGTRPRKKAEKLAYDELRSKIFEESNKNFKKFKQEFSDFAKDNPKAFSPISDIIESLGFLGQYPFGSGHGTRYWSTAGMTETEFFAHATESVAANNETLKLMQEMFPESMKIWETIVKDILRGGN